MLGVATPDFRSLSPNWSPASEFDGKGTASVQSRNHQGNAGAQLRVFVVEKIQGLARFCAPSSPARE